MSIRKETNYIILHHSANKNDTVESIDKYHKSLGWRCIGYHYVIYKDGTVHTGRKENEVGAHCYGYNYNSIGVCLIGNFEEEYPTEAQYNACKQLINELLNRYPNAKIIQHKDVYNTVCAGKFFDVNRVKPDTTYSVNNIVWELSNRGIITNKALWLNKLETDKNAYYLTKKTLDYLIKKGV